MPREGLPAANPIGALRAPQALGRTKPWPRILRGIRRRPIASMGDTPGYPHPTHRLDEGYSGVSPSDPSPRVGILRGIPVRPIASVGDTPGYHRPGRSPRGRYRGGSLAMSLIGGVMWRTLLIPL